MIYAAPPAVGKGASGTMRPLSGPAEPEGTNDLFRIVVSLALRARCAAGLAGGSARQLKWEWERDRSH